MWLRITGIILLSLLLAGTISSFIVYSVYIDTELSHLELDTCTLLLCYNVRFIYQWPKPPYYRGYYNDSTHPVSCPASLPCGFDDRDPIGTFGAWLHNGTDIVCINNACKVNINYSEWYLAIIGAIVIEALGLIAVIVSYIKYRQQQSVLALYDAEHYETDVFDARIE